jgi:hypothetical protein
MMVERWHRTAFVAAGSRFAVVGMFSGIELRSSCIAV